MSLNDTDGRSGIFQRTGQVWKAIAGLLSMLLGIGLIYWSISAYQTPQMKLPVLVAGTILAAIGTIYPGFAVRCPNCRDPWLWRAMSRRPHRQWLSWLLLQDNCPKCGYDP